MDNPASENHRFSDAIPMRLPIEWSVDGDVGPKPDVKGVSGKLVTITIEKNFRKIERIFAKVLRAPKVLHRRLYRQNSLLWELMDGERSFADICQLMDATFHEEVAPVSERVALGIDQFRRLNLAIIHVPEEE